MKSTAFPWVVTAVAVATAVSVGGFQASSSGAASPAENSQQVYLEWMDIGPGLESAAYSKAESLTDDQLKDRLKHLYQAWREEERWASFLHALYVHQKEHDASTHQKWNPTWSAWTGGLWVQTNMFGYRARQVLGEEFDRKSYLGVYAALAVRIERVREARVKLARGLMTDVLDYDGFDIFMDPWAPDDS